MWTPTAIANNKMLCLAIIPLVKFIEFSSVSFLMFGVYLVCVILQVRTILWSRQLLVATPLPHGGLLP